MDEYRAATPEDLERIWAMNIADHPGDERWVRWKDQLIGYNRNGEGITFVTVLNGRPVGEGTLLISPECKAVRNVSGLADGKRIVNLNGLRIRKEFEGQGHISKMVKAMENWAREHGFSTITIGVEANQPRNLGIYLHWGYTEFIGHEFEGDDLILYYGKSLV